MLQHSSGKAVWPSSTPNGLQTSKPMWIYDKTWLSIQYPHKLIILPCSLAQQGMNTRFRVFPKYPYIHTNLIRLVAEASITAEAEIVNMRVSFRCFLGDKQHPIFT